MRGETPQVSIYRSVSSFDVLEFLGRAMMDFGFAGLVDKFEDYFGKRVTKGLLILIGAAVASGSISLVFSFVVNPLFKLSMFLIDTSPAAYAKYELVVKGGLGLLLLIAMGAATVSVYQYRAITQKLQSLFETHGVEVDRDTAFYILNAALTLVEHDRQNPMSKILIKRWLLARRFILSADERKTFLRSPKSELPAPQLPQDTETKTPR